MRYAADNDIPREIFYPYKPQSRYLEICSAWGIDTSANIVYNYYDLTDSEIIQLLQDGPLNIAVSSSGWSSYSSGTYSCGSLVSIDHAVLLVGYTPSVWIIKNSYGTDWGDNGYIYVTRNRLFNCGIGHSAHALG